MVLDNSWVRGVLDLMFPRVCQGCNRVLHEKENLVCRVCVGDLPMCRFADPVDNVMARQLWGRVRFRGALSLLFFEGSGPFRQLLHGLKYKGRPELGIWLGRRMAEAYPQLSGEHGLYALCPVPLHPSKQAIRGYNQSEMIAMGMAEIWGIPVYPDLLKRERHTSSQTKKNRHARSENVATAFELSYAPELHGCIGLVDDVFTTGATMEACALQFEAIGMDVFILSIGCARN